MGIVGKANERAKLIGWLVSYAGKAQGVSHEIRTGRSLISAKTSDNPLLLLSTRDISSPHAAIRASLEHQVMLQDIFSDFGTYVTKAAGGEFQVTSPVELEHGDWLRIGETTRFQVCLIDGSRR